MGVLIGPWHWDMLRHELDKQSHVVSRSFTSISPHDSLFPKPCTPGLSSLESNPSICKMPLKWMHTQNALSKKKKQDCFVKLFCQAILSRFFQKVQTTTVWKIHQTLPVNWHSANNGNTLPSPHTPTQTKEDLKTEQQCTASSSGLNLVLQMSIEISWYSDSDPILCLIYSTTMTSAHLPEEDAC